MFTQTGCDPSKLAGQALERLAEEYGPSRIILLEYYLSADLYAKGAWDRADSFGGVGGTPTVYFDGPQNTMRGKKSYKEYKTQVDSERAKSASLVITAQKSMSGEKLDLRADVYNAGDTPLEDIQVWFLVYEDLEKPVRHHVVRDFSAGPPSFSSLAPGESEPFSIGTFDLSRSDMSKVEGVVFIQNRSTKEVLQAALATST